MRSLDKLKLISTVIEFFFDDDELDDSIHAIYECFLSSRDMSKHCYMDIDAWNRYMSEKSDIVFKKQFRLSKRLFKEVTRNISPYLEHNENRKGCLPIEVKLASTLRWLAGGSHYDITDIFRIKVSSFYAVKDDVINAINKAYNFQYDIINDENIMKEIAVGFQNKSSNGVFDKCIGAIDGWAPVLQRPSKKKVPNRQKLYSRKQYYTINVQVICDAKRYFRWYSILGTGNTHDSAAFQESSLYKDLQTSELLHRGEYYLVGDAAYKAESFMMTPYKGRFLPLDKDAYNFYQSQIRINVECALGLLQSRWGIFWRRVRCDPYKWGDVIEACMKLHNECVTDFYKNTSSGETLMPRSHSHCYEPPPMLAMGRALRGGITRGDVALRKNLRDKLHHLQMQRPPGFAQVSIMQNIPVGSKDTDEDSISNYIEEVLPSTYEFSYTLNSLTGEYEIRN